MSASYRFPCVFCGIECLASSADGGFIDHPTPCNAFLASEPVDFLRKVNDAKARQVGAIITESEVEGRVLRKS